ncbi:MAG: branched-chain alpha-keto acid dehydrogenase subunit E2 [Chitinivibrionales bacterium]|nr:branched-chain alpha-keto acid dehydrogenase subunit E2 [Chitinivibrionales bacterium]
MTEDVKLPEISENVDSGEVVNILVSQGDTVSREQPLMEVETDKASFEVPSPAEGTVAEIKVGKGDTVSVGQTILLVESGQGGASGKESENNKQPESEKQTGSGERQQPRPQEETGPAENKQEKTKPQPGGDAKKEKPAEHKPEPSAQNEHPSSAASVPAAPSVRREAREMGIDITQVEGSGPEGRIVMDDLKKHVRRHLEQQAPPSGVGPQPELPDFAQWGETTRQSLSKVRSITADAMTASWTTVPQVTQFDVADITRLEEYRRAHAEKLKKQDVKLSVTAVLAKIVASALSHFPQFNASLDMRQKDIIYKKYVNIGIAVDTDRGLLVPVVRDADRKGIIEIARELSDLAGRARGKKIDPAELQGGNFTISNLGGIGGTNFTPIIYHPQVAILGVARAGKQPVIRDGELEERLMLPLSLTYDHRLIDGADGARFLRWIAESLQNPIHMHLEGGRT